MILQPNTSVGVTWHKTVSAATTNATSVSTAGTALYYIHASNANAAVRYLKIYNKASAPTVGTDTPSITLMLPAANQAMMSFLPYGIRFPAGVGFALTTEATDAGTTAVSASEHIVHIGYTSE